MNGATALIDLPPEPESSGWARRHASAALGAWQVPPETEDTAILIVSELVTNAIRGATRVRVTLRVRPGQVVIEVADDDLAPPVPASPGPDDEAGRGLLIVGALCKEWGTRQGVGGKVVFAVLGMPDAEGT